jgi:hypothetical protein
MGFFKTKVSNKKIVFSTTKKNGTNITPICIQIHYVALDFE